MSRFKHACLAALVCAMFATPALADNNGVITGGKLQAANGEQVYTHICQGCHMPDGQGAKGAGTYPAFANNPRLASAAYVASTVLYGRRNMPSFIATPNANPMSFFMRTSLTDAQIAEAVNYVRTHFGNHYSDKLSAADVTALHQH